MGRPARAQNVQTPGAEAVQADGEQGDQVEQGDQPAALAPDLQALVQMEVARTLARSAASRAAAQANPAGDAPLPTHDEALKQVLSDPKRRSVLSRDGWVTATKPDDAKNFKPA